LTALSLIVYNENVDSIQRCDISRTLSCQDWTIIW